MAEAGAWRRTRRPEGRGEAGRGVEPTRRPARPLAVAGLRAAGRAAVRRWDVLLSYSVAALAGAAAGLTLAAGGLALAGRSLFDLPAETAEAVLAGGPLLGLLPAAGIILVAQRRRAVAGHLPFLILLWLVVALLATGLFGLRPLLH